ncbi:recombinase family protein [Actinokineospora cianjurensis]|uniref:recombinase family protein n=1 Tax=Actinokineospora cianjurensis TaxID=585224 RepID=UPI001FEC8233|nr:recombinase family protein [Actinokineospora cianjurensis]
MSASPWSRFDELFGVEVDAGPVDDGVGDLAFYGRCSTEDNQDPDTSHGWQRGNAEKFVGPLGGRLVAGFFDIGQSRSVPWERRDEASRLLAALKDPRRTWTGVVVGEGTRCWFGNQFSLIAPRFEAYGVDLWVPELGGKYDSRNPSHKMLMSVLGGMSESERQHVQARVRAAMDAQVVNEGRHQGGRAPYGYRVVDAGPHPNPRKAAEGFRLRVLALDESAAEVVERIFADYLNGKGDRAIANALNREAIPCPSAARPEQNRHRIADGWQATTVRSILENPRYTGYAFFGRWTRREMLLDPDDVGAGHVVRFKRADADKVVRSREQAHPVIVPVEVFTEVQLRRRGKGAGGLRATARNERAERPTKRTYLFRGHLRCAVCTRKMEGSPRKHGMYYRCPARTLAPGSPALASHPPTVYLREEPLQKIVNEWLMEVLHPARVDATVQALLEAQGTATGAADHEAARKRLRDAEGRLRRYQEAIGAGIDPAALVDAMNQAQAEKFAAQAELGEAPEPGTVSAAEIYAMIDSLGDVQAMVDNADPANLAALYDAMGLEIRYFNDEAAVEMTAALRVNSVRVRGGT